MAPETKPPPEVRPGAGSQFDQAWQQIDCGCKPSQPTLQVVHATLIGNSLCIAENIVGRGNAPVLALCRKLVDAGHDSHSPLVAYREGLPCLYVRSIGIGAQLAVSENGRGPVFRRWDGPQSDAASLPVRGNASPSNMGAGA